MKINDELRLRRADNKNFIVAVGEKSKTFYNTVKLNDTAAQIFEEIRNGRTNEAIAQKLAKDYEISYEDAIKDVDSVILEFKKAGFFDD